jgi:hypothetical protein
LSNGVPVRTLVVSAYHTGKPTLAEDNGRAIYAQHGQTSKYQMVAFWKLHEP